MVSRLINRSCMEADTVTPQMNALESIQRKQEVKVKSFLKTAERVLLHPARTLQWVLALVDLVNPIDFLFVDQTFLSFQKMNLFVTFRILSKSTSQRKEE